MEVVKYLSVKEKILAIEQYKKELDQIAAIKNLIYESGPLQMKTRFITQYAWVLLSFGNDAEQANKEYNSLIDAWDKSTPINEALSDFETARSIMYVMANISDLLNAYLEADHKLSWISTLPMITKESTCILARNLGEDCIRLELRVAEIAGEEGPQKMCERISKATGDKLSYVDHLIWRAEQEGMI